MAFPQNVFCNILLYAGDTIPYSKCDQASDLWQQLDLASKLSLGLLKLTISLQFF